MMQSQLIKQDLSFDKIHMVCRIDDSNLVVVDAEFVYKLNKQTLKLSLKSRHFLTDVAQFTDLIY